MPASTSKYAYWASISLRHSFGWPFPWRCNQFARQILCQMECPRIYISPWWWTGARVPNIETDQPYKRMGNAAACTTTSQGSLTCTFDKLRALPTMCKSNRPAPANYEFKIPDILWAQAQTQLWVIWITWDLQCVSKSWQTGVLLY